MRAYAEQTWGTWDGRADLNLAWDKIIRLADTDIGLSRRPIRRSRHATQKGDHRGRIADAVSISERPASAEDRAVPGHWEGDLLCGAKNSYIVTLVERHSRYLMLAKISNRETQTVVDALIRQARRLPNELYTSLTWDRGKELADHKRFTMETNIDVYFCDPQSPWQRGSNENTNRLLRQYFPRGIDLAPHSQAELNKVARQLNQRPRKTLDFQSPAERFNQCVALTGLNSHLKGSVAILTYFRSPEIYRFWLFRWNC